MRTLVITPGSVIGTTIIQLFVTDTLMAAAQTSFVFTVNRESSSVSPSISPVPVLVSAFPTISHAATVQTTALVATRAIVIMVGQGTPPLILTASSDNETLVPSGNIAVSPNQGFNRTLVITPATLGLTGTVRIYLAVSDAANATATSFFDLIINGMYVLEAEPD